MREADVRHGFARTIAAGISPRSRIALIAPEPGRAPWVLPRTHDSHDLQEQAAIVECLPDRLQVRRRDRNATLSLEIANECSGPERLKRVAGTGTTPRRHGH
jgi:hypothetical protein